MKILKYLLITLFIAGCNDTIRDIHPEFGYRYKLASYHYPDYHPVISNDTLRIPVLHGGCEGNHDFNLQYDVSHLSYSEVWLFKETPDQFCEASVLEIKSYPLPQEVAMTNEIYLLGPKGERILLSR